MIDFDAIVKDYILRECLIIDKEYKSQGRDVQKEGIEQSELKQRVRQRLLSDHPELQSEIETKF